MHLAKTMQGYMFLRFKIPKSIQATTKARIAITTDEEYGMYMEDISRLKKHTECSNHKKSWLTCYVCIA